MNIAMLVAQVTAEPSTVVRIIVQPIDVVALTNAALNGLTALVGSIAAIYAVVSAARSRRAEIASKTASDGIDKVKDNLLLIERNTNSMTAEIARLSRGEGVHEGELKGVRTAEAAARNLAEGQRQGVASERASAAAATPHPSSLAAPDGDPLPVEDDRTATAGERSADALERAAKAQVRVADAAERKRP